MRLKPLVVLGFWLSVFAGFGVYRHRLYLARLVGYPLTRDSAPPPARSGPAPDVSPFSGRPKLLLGWTQTLSYANESAFWRHSPEKPPGRIRIGIFGDSHIEGDEVGKDADFPTLLQRRFDAAGQGNVEVLNFGVGGYGFNQAFLMWELFSKQYALDRSAFALGTHYFERDDTFWFLDDNFFSIHARYALRNGKAELMEPIGSSLDDISFRYHGLRPVWQYLRYDARLPLLARMLLSAPTASRFNPFYYAPFGDTKKELLEIYRLLLTRAAEQSPLILLFDRNFAPYEEALAGPAPVDSMDYGEYQNMDELLRAPMSHFNALGNRLRAEEFYAYLTGKKSVTLPTVRLVPLPRAEARQSRRLYEISDGVLTADGRPAWRLMVHKHDAPQPHFFEPLNLRERRVAALFLVDGGRPAFVPLPGLVNPSDEIALSFTLDGETQRVVLGRPLAPLGIVASLDRGTRDSWQGVSSRTKTAWEIRLPRESPLLHGFSIRTAGKVTDVRLLLGARELLKGAGAEGGLITLAPSDGVAVELRAEPGQDFDPFRAAPRGLVSVGNGVPFMDYRIEFSLKKEFKRPLRNPLVAAGSRAP